MLSILAAAATATLAAPTPPDALTPFLNEQGHLKPAAFEWVAGAFEDASEAERADYAAIQSWSEDCTAWANAERKARWDAAGVEIEGRVGPAIRTECALFSDHVGRLAERFQSKSAFLAALDKFKPRVEGGADAMQFADMFFEPSKGDPNPRQLDYYTVALADQYWRYRATDWKPLADGEAEAALLTSLITIEMGRADFHTREWLRADLAEHGWPKKSEHGTTAALVAWLVAQHADADPLFQLEALAMMEPMVEQGEASGSQFALLTDRTMLKTKGVQRYGSQVSCIDGTRAPFDLEQEDGLDERRASVGLPPIADYLAMMEDRLGACPATQG